MTFTYENDFTQFLAARDRGELCEVDEEMYMYWLGVLPPVFMHRTVTLCTGREVRAEFGFAEGAERVTAFWPMRQPIPGGTTETVYYAQYSNLWSNGG